MVCRSVLVLKAAFCGETSAEKKVRDTTRSPASKRWPFSKVPNWMQYISTGIHFDGVRIQGKVFRERLNTEGSQGSSESAFASKIILHLVVIARKIKDQPALVRLKNQPPRQPGAALVKMFAQLPNRQTGVRVRISKSFDHEFQGGGNLRLPPRFPHNLFEPPGQLNGNHSCPR